MPAADSAEPELERLPHIAFTPPPTWSSLSTSSDSDVASTLIDTHFLDTMQDGTVARSPIAPSEEALLAMQELRMNTTHPFLTHTLRQQESSVLSLAADSRHIFSGSQGKDIYVWDRETMQLERKLQGHSGSVLMLELSEEKEWLFSSSSDSTVRIWSTTSLAALYVIHPFGETDAGDIYSLAFSHSPAGPPVDPESGLSASAERSILFFGCQNTSLQWIDLSSQKLACPGSVALNAAASSQTQPSEGNVRLPRLNAVAAGSGTESSSDWEMEYEFEDEEDFKGDHGLDDADDEHQHTQDEGQPSSFDQSHHRASSRPRRPKKLHKFFDSQPRSQRHIQTLAAQAVQEAPPPRPVAVAPDARPSLLNDVHRTASFSSIGSIERPVPIPMQNHDATRAQQTPPLRRRRLRPRVLRVPDGNVAESAHYGYIYCMALVPATDPQIRPFGTYEPEQRYSTDLNAREEGEIRLVTGSGDEEVKLWSFRPQIKAPSLLHTFKAPPAVASICSPAGCGGAVLSVMVRNGCIYAGYQDGLVVVWSLTTSSVVRSIVTKECADVLSLSLIDTDLYTCLSDGEIQRWSGSFACTAAWKAHDGIVLSSIIVPAIPCAAKRSIVHPETSVALASNIGPRWALITGASDNHIKLWDIERPQSLTAHTLQLYAKEISNNEKLDIVTRPPFEEKDVQTIDPIQEINPHVIPGRGVSNETMVHALTEFVAIPSVTASEPHREFCRQAAIWLQASLDQLGAEAYILPSLVEGKNPLVLGTFHRTSASSERRPRVLFYGHYDVIPAPSQASSSNSWRSPPFTLTGVNGYLYGRGVTDNKGPIMASACAVATLVARGELDCDVVFLIEGEEEAGSVGFSESVRAYKDRIGHIDSILLSNSYWIDDDTPCITYGLRGVVQASLEVAGHCPELHSGVEGGAWNEPMMDMVKLLGTLSNQTRIAIPSFYDTVRPETSFETQTYAGIAELTGTTPTKIASRWREPSLTVHNVNVSGSNNPTVIPASVRAQISIRIVPDQDLPTIVEALEDHLLQQFNALGTTNELKITIDRTADWWLGQLDDQWFSSLEQSVKDEWGVQPLHIREGGSIPSIPFLEKEFGCHALHLPMGQSSDQAHLQNERISLNNLYKGRSVVERFFRSLSAPGFLSQ